MKLKEIVEICYGKNQKQVEVENSSIPILGTGGVIGYASKCLYDRPSVLIGRKGTIGMPFFIEKPFWTIDTLFYTKINESIVIPKFLYYLLCTIGLSHYQEGAAVPSLTTKTLYEIDLDIPSLSVQQHIVDTIGSVDNLIENYLMQFNKILQLGVTKINYLNDCIYHQPLSKISLFEKGIEIGSSNYFEHSESGLLPYLRVGDLLNPTYTFIDEDISRNIAVEDDILVAFDGAPGRNAIGLYGSFSSGLYKMICKDKYKGIAFFEINSSLNQKIIKDHCQGTTILHASKSINYLECIDCNEQDCYYFEQLYKILVTLKKKIKLLTCIKHSLLNRYFTNR